MHTVHLDECAAQFIWLAIYDGLSPWLHRLKKKVSKKLKAKIALNKKRLEDQMVVKKRNKRTGKIQVSATQAFLHCYVNKLCISALCLEHVMSQSPDQGPGVQV